jgi:excisionase family DNA binding protein
MSPIEEALEAVIESVVRRVVREELAAARAAPADELVTMATFARQRSISESTVRAAIRAGRLPAMKIGRAVRVRANAQIGEPAPTSSADTPRARAARILGLKP